MKNKTKKELFDFLLSEVSHNRGSVFELQWNSGRRKLAKGTCSYDTDNARDLDDPKYEEYEEIAFRDLATKELFPINYHNLPDEVWCDGKLVYKREIRRNNNTEPKECK